MSVAFLEKIQDRQYQRDSINGLKPFFENTVQEKFSHLYTKEEIEELQTYKGTERDVEGRMKVKTSAWYADLASRSTALKNLISARSGETLDLSGEADPSNQNSYSPVKGLLHKYPEIVLLYSAMTCSAHCRYCYRLDLFDGSTGKGLANPEEVKQYILKYNSEVAANNYKDPETGEPLFPVTEALLSGGDPMVLANSKLGKYMAAMAEAGISTVRIGTKELSFFPHRFDETFMNMLDAFHESYPHTHVAFMTHFTHPDEFLARDENGNRIQEGQGFKWMSEVENPVKELGKRYFVSLENQTPIIKDVNDNADELRILQHELRKNGVHCHYFFQCREIRGYKAFAIPVEETLRIFNDSQKGLSGNEQSAKFVMSTEFGKMEVVGVAKGDEAKAFGAEGIVIFKANRSPHKLRSRTQGELVIAKSDPDALWISDYINKGSILFDGTGEVMEAQKEALSDKAQKQQPALKAVQSSCGTNEASRKAA